jgi:hypothetical protein
VIPYSSICVTDSGVGARRDEGRQTAAFQFSCCRLISVFAFGFGWIGPHTSWPRPQRIGMMLNVQVLIADDYRCRKNAFGPTPSWTTIPAEPRHPGRRYVGRGSTFNRVALRIDSAPIGDEGFGASESAFRCASLQSGRSAAHSQPSTPEYLMPSRDLVTNEACFGTAGHGRSRGKIPDDAPTAGESSRPPVDHWSRSARL